MNQTSKDKTEQDVWASPSPSLIQGYDPYSQQGYGPCSPGKSRRT